MLNKSLDPSSGKELSENKSGAVESTSGKCRFCSSSEHTTINCNVYPSVKPSVTLASQKGWCTTYLSGKHRLAKCPGKSVLLPFKCHKCKNPSIKLLFVHPLRILLLRVLRVI